MKFVNIGHAFALSGVVMLLAGCGGGGGGSSSATSSSTSYNVVPNLYPQLVGKYTATWTSPNSNATGTFDVDITSGPPPMAVGPDPKDNVLLLTTTGTLPQLQSIADSGGEINDFAEIGPGNYQLNAAGTSISVVGFGGWLFDISAIGPVQGYNAADIVLNISPSQGISGTLSVPEFVTNSAGGTAAITQVFDISLKPQ